LKGFKSQTAIIEARLDQLLSSGYTKKSIIYEMVVKELGVARPTVRRVAAGLKEKYRIRLQILDEKQEYVRRKSY